MDEKVFEEITQKHDIAEAFISLFFAAADAFIFLIILCLFGCDSNKNCFSHRQKLSLLILFDAILRIVSLYINSFIYSFLTDIILTIFATIQFYLIISLFNQIFTTKFEGNLLETPEIKYTFLSSLIFFVISINLKISKMISLVQYICGIAAIIFYKYYVGRKVNIFLIEVEKISKFSSNNIIENFPLVITFYYIIYYIMKIIRLYIENALFQSYMEMICDIFKEVGKYLTFGLMIILYYLFNKYIQKEYYDSSNEGTVNISSISSSNINN